MEHESLEMETDETQISKIQDENKRRAAERRSLETADERERRLESNRIRIARKRATETEFEREQRLTSLRKKLAEKRSKETQEQRERRLETNRKRIADRRSDTNKEAWSLQNWVGGSFNAPEVVSTSMAANTSNQHTAVMSSVDTAKDTSQATITPQVNGASKIIVTETKPESNLESHYNELLRMIGEIGRDVKPAYTNSKVSTDRLRRSIMIARGVLRECLGDLDKLAAASHSSSSS